MSDKIKQALTTLHGHISFGGGGSTANSKSSRDGLASEQRSNAAAKTDKETNGNTTTVGKSTGQVVNREAKESYMPEKPKGSTSYCVGITGGYGGFGVEGSYCRTEPDK